LKSISAPIPWDKLPQEYIDPIFQILEKYRGKNYEDKFKTLLLKEIKEELDRFLKIQQVRRGDRLIIAMPRLEKDELTVNFAYANQ
jgi:hypothetical protein